MRQFDVYVKNKKDLLEVYNENCVSENLINYILKGAKYIDKYEEISVCLHVSKETKGCTNMIKEALEDACNKNMRRHSIINVRQIILMFLGLVILLMSTLIDKSSIINELILIIGWVPIWVAVELELITDTQDKRQYILLKKILNSEFKEIIED